jgi:hypothetical protein
MIYYRNLTFVSLFVYLVSLAATQTVYGSGFGSLRWIALIAFGVFGALSRLSSAGQLVPRRVTIYVSIYLMLWSMTAVFGVYPAYSAYRLLAHGLVLISCLIFLPQVITLTNAPKILTALKLLVALTLIVSYIRPAPLNIFDIASQYRGIFGNANSFGHMCAVGSLIFLHGFLTKGRSLWKYTQLALTILATVLMFRSGARSSAISLLAGFLTLSLFYRKQFSRNLLAVWAMGTALLVTATTMQPQIKAFTNKHSGFEQINDPIDRLSASRLPVLTASWEAFEERPLFGWGFGVDKDTDLANWKGELTSLGFTKRDPVNDLTYSLETGGIAGAFAYFFLLSLIPRLWVTRDRVQLLHANLYPSEITITQSALNAQQLFMCLTVLLFVMFEFDGTALSAGYFFASLFWASFGICIGLRSLLLIDLPLKIYWARIARRQTLLINS